MATSDQNMIAALLRERDTYQRQGKTERVAQVDEQLARRGYTPDDQEPGPQGRTAKDPAQQSADAAAGDSAAAGTGDAEAAPEPEPKKAPVKKAAASSRAAAKE